MKKYSSTEIDALESFYHEICNLNNLLEKTAHNLRTAIPKKAKDNYLSAIVANTNKVSEIVELFNFHISLVTLQCNPEFYSFQEKQDINIHGIFFKNVKIFKSQAKKKYIKIQLNYDEQIPRIPSHPIINVVPFIILDNAVKYSPTNSSVDIYFNLSKDYLNICCESIGPKLNNAELEAVFRKNYRSVNAKKINPNGNGIGLYFLSKICDLCNCEYSITSGESSFTVESIAYSKFCLELNLPRYE